MGIPLPTEDPTELYRYDSLDGFLDVFWLVQSTLCTRADWARLAYEAALDSAAHAGVHQECFFTPTRHLVAGQDLGDIVAGLDEGIAAAEEEARSTCMLNADMDRAFGPGAGRDLVEELAALRRAGTPGAERVIGIGMDSTVSRALCVRRGVGDHAECEQAIYGAGLAPGPSAGGLRAGFTPVWSAEPADLGGAWYRAEA